MVKLTAPTDPAPECEVSDITVKENVQFVRPCERYKELYKSCSGWEGRLRQYYIYGETLDCSEYINNYKICMQYRKTKDLKLLDPIIDWELNLVQLRLKTVEQNKAWEFRDTPPTDFNAPLPDHIAQRQKKSSFARVSS